MNSKRRKLLFLLFFLLVFGIYYLLEKREKSPDLAEHNVLNVIDGDTVIIDDDKKSRIRYLGIDTPEIAYQGSLGDPMSEEAKDFNAKLVQGKIVKLEFDEEKYDVYGRILAYVYVDDLLVNEELLKEGLATALIIEPNGMYSEIIFLLRKGQRGLGYSVRLQLPRMQLAHHWENLSLSFSVSIRFSFMPPFSV